MFYQISEQPMTCSSWHIKSAITTRYISQRSNIKPQTQTSEWKPRVQVREVTKVSYSKSWKSGLVSETRVRLNNGNFPSYWSKRRGARSNMSQLMQVSKWFWLVIVRLTSDDLGILVDLALTFTIHYSLSLLTHIFRSKCVLKTPLWEIWIEIESFPG